MPGKRRNAATAGNLPPGTPGPILGDGPYQLPPDVDFDANPAQWRKIRRIERVESIR